MSLYFGGLNGLCISIPDGKPDTSWNGFPFLNVVRQIDEVVTISKTAGPSTLQLTTTPRLAGLAGSVTWNGFQLEYAPQHGQGWTNADTYRITGPNTGSNFTTINGSFFAPGMGGSRADSGGLYVCGSKVLYFGVDPNLDRYISVANAVFWEQPGDPNQAEYNQTVLSNMITWVETILGENGDPFVIRTNRKVLIPSQPILQTLLWSLRSPCSLYVPNTVVSVCESINLNDGTTQVVDPGMIPSFLYSESTDNPPKAFMCSSADAQVAVCAYAAPSQMQPYGFYMIRQNASMINTLVWDGPPQFVNGVPPGIFEDTSYSVFGTRAQVINSVMALPR